MLQSLSVAYSYTLQAHYDEIKSIILFMCMAWTLARLMLLRVSQRFKLFQRFLTDLSLPLWPVGKLCYILVIPV